MYKVKRFSAYTTNRVRYCQKTYGLIDGVKRSINKYRSKIADKLQNSIDKTAIKNNNIRDTLKNPAPRVYDIEKNLVKEARLSNSRILKFNGLGSSNNTTSLNARDRRLDESINAVFGKRAGNKTKNAIKSSDNIILYSPTDGTGGLAHELGHIRNSNSKNIVKRSISKYANDPKVRNSMMNGEAMTKSGLRESGKRLIRGLAILAEESNASRDGIKLMKKHGATKSQVIEAKKRLKDSRRTYEENLKWNVKYPLKNMIKPKE